MAPFCPLLCFRSVDSFFFDLDMEICFFPVFDFLFGLIGHDWNRNRPTQNRIRRSWKISLRYWLIGFYEKLRNRSIRFDLTKRQPLATWQDFCKKYAPLFSLKDDILLLSFIIHFIESANCLPKSSNHTSNLINCNRGLRAFEGRKHSWFLILLYLSD